jgi:hypothetical protein
MNKATLLSSLSPPLDRTLADLLITEFISLEQRYALADWEPAELDGGQFVEICGRIVYHIDAGNLNQRKAFDDCVKYVEDERNSNTHGFPVRRTALHICRVLRTVYKFRSQRGAVHIDPDYNANELDAGMIIANVRWLMAEILRVFWTADRSQVSRAIREIVRYQVPAVLSIDGRHLVLRTDCDADEEILILLHNVGEIGMTRGELGTSVQFAPSTITNGLKLLGSPKYRQVIKTTDGKYVLTPLGTKRLKEDLSRKLTLA